MDGYGFDTQTEEATREQGGGGPPGPGYHYVEVVSAEIRDRDGRRSLNACLAVIDGRQAGRRIWDDPLIYHPVVGSRPDALRIAPTAAKGTPEAKAAAAVLSGTDRLIHLSAAVGGSKSPDDLVGKKLVILVDKRGWGAVEYRDRLEVKSVHKPEGREMELAKSNMERDAPDTGGGASGGGSGATSTARDTYDDDIPF